MKEYDVVLLLEMEDPNSDILSGLVDQLNRYVQLAVHHVISMIMGNVIIAKSAVYDEACFQFERTTIYSI